MGWREWSTGRTSPVHVQRIVHSNGQIEEKRISGDYTAADAARARKAIKAGGSERIETKDGRVIVQGRAD